MNGEQARQVTAGGPAPLPGNGPPPNLGSLMPPYRAEDSAWFPPCVLQNEDIDFAFAARDGSSWALHRMQRMNLQVLPLVQLMDVADRAEHSLARRSLGSESSRDEAVNIALIDAQTREIKAIARLARCCRLPESGALLALTYTLESLTVLPVHRNKGFDRVLASGLAALIGRELEQLAHGLWHTHTLSVKVSFNTSAPAASAAALRGIVTTRLRDELIAQDSLLQLDGKLSRFLPLA